MSNGPNNELDFDTPLSQLLAAIGASSIKCANGAEDFSVAAMHLSTALETVQKCKYVEMFGLVIEAGALAGDTGDEPDTPASDGKATDKTKAH